MASRHSRSAEGRRDLGATLAAAARAVYDSPFDNALHGRPHALLTGVAADAARQPRLSAHQLDAILREASPDRTVDETASVP